MEGNLEFFFSILFTDENQAEIVYRSLSPEIRAHTFERSKIFLQLKPKKLIIKMAAKDLNAAKASINSLLKWISAIESLFTLIST